MKSTIFFLSIFLVTFHADAIGVPYIFRGCKAKEGQFPHQVSIQKIINTRNISRCGGSIMSSRWILTCNHCIPKDLLLYKVVVGTILSDNGTDYEIDSAVQHPNYDRDAPSAVRHAGSDIALIKVKKDIKFDFKTKPISIDTDFIDGGVDVFICGWGKTENGPRNELMYVKMTTISNKRCEEMSHGRRINPDRLCTIAPGGFGTCNGDSGSSVIYNGKIIGMVSVGIRPCGYNPELNVRVAYYKEWIYKYVNGTGAEAQ